MTKNSVIVIMNNKCRQPLQSIHRHLRYVNNTFLCVGNFFLLQNLFSNFKHGIYILLDTIGEGKLFNFVFLIGKKNVYEKSILYDSPRNIVILKQIVFTAAIQSDFTVRNAIKGIANFIH